MLLQTWRSGGSLDYAGVNGVYSLSADGFHLVLLYSVTLTRKGFTVLFIISNSYSDICRDFGSCDRLACLISGD